MGTRGMQNVLGVDVGGANIKLADATGRARVIPFPLWRQRDQLEWTLREACREWVPTRGIALTMTGELADCFSCRAEGVEWITRAMVRAAAGVEVHVWQTAGEFVDPDTACEYPQLTAAANWHALATWAARVTLPDRTGLLIDWGSTTVDIIPLQAGAAQPQGRTDYERLISGELVYTGGTRTPVCAVCQRVEQAGVSVPLAAELFATMQDVYLLTGDLPEATDSLDTADGRPADRTHAAQRLARMLCRDAAELPASAWEELAWQIALAQQQQVCAPLRQVLERLTDPVQHVVFSGSAAYLARRAWEHLSLFPEAEVVSLEDSLSPAVSTAACAHALVQLWLESVARF